jgi:hypothetical protein
MSQAKPCWNWTGVEALNFQGHDRLYELVAMLPSRRSTDSEITTYLVDLHARFQRWLHQDEFGPSRRQQTAALRSLIRLLQKLEKHLIKGPPLAKNWLDATLRCKNEPRNTTLEVLYAAAVDVESDLRVDDTPKHEIIWAAGLRDRVYELMAGSQSLDTNTEAKIFPIAMQRHFDPLQAIGPDCDLAKVEHWLNAYWNVLVATLSELNSRRGAEERVSLKLLIEQLCKLWEHETGCSVTAHGQVKDVRTGRAETRAGKFVTAAVEAMLPHQAWFDQRTDFVHSVRAQTFLPRCQGARARQVLGIMKNFVKRRANM